jgi:hypothetical protein
VPGLSHYDRVPGRQVLPVSALVYGVIHGLTYIFFTAFGWLFVKEELQ